MLQSILRSLPSEAFHEAAISFRWSSAMSVAQELAKQTIGTIVIISCIKRKGLYRQLQRIDQYMPKGLPCGFHVHGGEHLIYLLRERLPLRWCQLLMRQLEAQCPIAQLAEAHTCALKMVPCMHKHIQRIVRCTGDRYDMTVYVQSGGAV